MIIMGSYSQVLHKNICCGYSLEAPQRGASNEYPQDMILWKNKKNYPRISIECSSFKILLFTHYCLDIFRG